MCEGVRCKISSTIHGAVLSGLRWTFVRGFGRQLLHRLAATVVVMHEAVVFVREPSSTIKLTHDTMRRKVFPMDGSVEMAVEQMQRERMVQDVSTHRTNEGRISSGIRDLSSRLVLKDHVTLVYRDRLWVSDGLLMIGILRLTVGVPVIDELFI